MWYEAENGEAVRPADLDTTSSKAYVYVRRNIVFVEGTDETPAHYKWEECRIPKDAWAVWQKAAEHDAALDDVYAALTELAEMILEEG